MGKFSHKAYPKRETWFVAAERFLSQVLFRIMESILFHQIYGCDTWYPSQACQFLKLKHHTHCPDEKSIIERTI
jgi:hypothetical protein